MAVIDPLKVVITNLSADFPKSLRVADFPNDETKSHHDVPFCNVIYIDKSDFREVGRLLEPLKIHFLGLFNYNLKNNKNIFHSRLLTKTTNAWRSTNPLGSGTQTSQSVLRNQSRMTRQVRSRNSMSYAISCLGSQSQRPSFIGYQIL